VYHIPTMKDARTDAAWALQRLFYSLQISKTAVSTQELTKSFGWDTIHLFEQQDAVEMLRKLLERLEKKMKGSPVENALPDLFTGKIRAYISCLNVDYESSRTEVFWDLQLNVAQNKSLDDSFKEYIEVTPLDGEQQYFTGEKYGLQDAVKGVIFESFPPVLNISLKRYQYDLSRDVLVKLNDYHEFPEEFDAAPYLSAAADKSEPWTYLLVGVIVHDGDLNHGSYYAYVRPAKNGQFYKFLDDRVTPATLKEAINENFGGDDTNPTKKNKTAYILTYIRKSRLDQVLGEITKDDLPEHLTDFGISPLISRR
jgi:ubiquitin carboxyl-terminal hydrolase 7